MMYWREHARKLASEKKGVPRQTKKHHAEDVYVAFPAVEVCKRAVGRERTRQSAAEQLVADAVYLAGDLVCFPNIVLVGYGDEIACRSGDGREEVGVYTLFAFVVENVHYCIFVPVLLQYLPCSIR